MASPQPLREIPAARSKPVGAPHEETSPDWWENGAPESGLRPTAHARWWQDSAEERVAVQRTRPIKRFSGRGRSNEGRAISHVRKRSRFRIGYTPEHSTSGRLPEVGSVTWTM
jgi:hypothetical protein